MRRFLSRIFGPQANTNRRNRQKKRTLQVEALERRDLMSVFGGMVGGTTGTLAPVSGEPTAAGLALINKLADANVRSRALADYQSDGMITRNDMIDIFFYSTTGFTILTNVASVSLSQLVANGRTVGMPEYVRNLASKALNGTSTPVGGLSPAQTLKQKVDDFFLGLNRPDAGSTSYVQVNKPLWNSYPSRKDVNQTYYSPTNWLLTSLEEVVSHRRADIMSMFIDNGDNTYTVRFYPGYQPDYVTVDKYFPQGAGQALGDPNSGVLWVSLLMKAYAQENAAGGIGSLQPGVNSYAALGFLGGPQAGDAGNPAWAFRAITGAGFSSPPRTFSLSDADVKSIAHQWSGGNYVVLRTVDNYFEQIEASPLLYPECDHPAYGDCGGATPHPRWYALVNYVPDASVGGRFTVTLDGKRFIEVAGRVLADNFSMWVLGEPHRNDSGNSAQAAPQPGTAVGVTATFANTVAGFTQSVAKPVVVAQTPTQPSQPQNTAKALTAPSGSQVNKALPTSPSAVTKRGVTLLASSDAAVRNLFDNLDV